MGVYRGDTRQMRGKFPYVPAGKYVARDGRLESLHLPGNGLEGLWLQRHKCVGRLPRVKMHCEKLCNNVKSCATIPEVQILGGLQKFPVTGNSYNPEICDETTPGPPRDLG